MENNYTPICDMSYQEWTTKIGEHEDRIGSGSTIVSFKAETLELKVLSFYNRLKEWGDKNHLLEYETHFNLSIERK